MSGHPLCLCACSFVGTKGSHGCVCVCKNVNLLSSHCCDVLSAHTSYLLGLAMAWLLCWLAWQLACRSRPHEYTLCTGPNCLNLGRGSKCAWSCYCGTVYMVSNPWICQVEMIKSGISCEERREKKGHSCL